MAGKGPPKVPVAILQARGSALAKLPDRANEPKSLPEADMAAPDMLTGEAAAAWNRIIAPLFRYQGIVTVIDRDAAIMLCQSWKTYVEAYNLCESEGYELHTEKGVVPNPAQRRMWDALDRYFRIAPHFGITPANRSRLTNAITKRPESETKDKGRFFKAG